MNTADDDPDEQVPGTEERYNAVETVVWLIALDNSRMASCLCSLHNHDISIYITKDGGEGITKHTEYCAIDYLLDCCCCIAGGGYP